MPQYSFKCDSCNILDIKNMPISKFLKFKKKEVKCKKCKKGNLKHQIISVSSKIDRNAEE